MQSGASYRLIVRRGPQPNQQYDLTRETVTVGRDITNDIRTATGGYSIEDLRSTNGTFVNRQRITSPHQLANGDMIGMGETVTLAYEITGVGDAAATAMGYGQQQPAPAAGYPPPASRPPSAPPAAMSIADEEDFRPDRNRWIVIGCAALTVLFCFALLASVIVVDYFNLYCDLPLSDQIFNCLP